MIYFVTAQQQFFETSDYQLCSVEDSIKMIESFTNHWVQLDTETTGLDPHIDKCLLLQFGNVEETIQIVVDAITINIKVYDEVISYSYESKSEKMRKSTLIDTRTDELFLPVPKRECLIGNDKKLKLDLLVTKRVASASSRSFTHALRHS